MEFSNRLQLNFDKLTDNQLKIAKQLTRLVEKKPYKINELAKVLNTSASTISKTVKKLGYPSYQNFVATIYLNDREKNINKNEIETMAHYYSEMINKTKEMINIDILTEVVSLISSAHKILVVGIGNSGLSAIELDHRLERMGINIKAITDPHRMVMQSKLVNNNDLVIGISNSGETSCIVDTLKSAKKSGASTLSITNFPNNSLSNHSNHSIVLSSSKLLDDDKFINSQMQIIFLIDTVCYILLNNKKFLNNRSLTLKSLIDLN